MCQKFNRKRDACQEYRPNFWLAARKCTSIRQQLEQRSRFQPSAVGCERRLRRRSSGHPVQQSAAQAQVVNSIGIRDASHSLIHRHNSFPRASSRCNFPPQTLFASFSRLSRFNSSPPSSLRASATPRFEINDSLPRVSRRYVQTSPAGIPSRSPGVRQSLHAASPN